MLTQEDARLIRAQAMSRLDASIDRLLAGKRSCADDERLFVELITGARINAHATAKVTHRRPTDFDRAGKPLGFVVLGEDQVDEAFGPRDRLESLLDGLRQGTLPQGDLLNLVINAGRIYMFNQCYANSGIGAGLNFIANSPDAISGHETATSTTLSAEVTTNGLSRAAATITAPTGSGNTGTIDKTFTATGAITSLKSAVFNASSAGTMQHVLEYSGSKTLANTETLQVTITITFM
jgi:hypothetical protein